MEVRGLNYFQAGIGSSNGVKAVPFDMPIIRIFIVESFKKSFIRDDECSWF